MDPPKKINWNDYSDDGSSITQSEPSALLNNPQIQKLHQIDPTFKYVWLILKYNHLDERSKHAIQSIRFKEKNYAVYHSEETKTYQIKVDREYAIKLISGGINKINNITVHSKNFKNKPRVNIKSRGKNYKKEFKSEGKKYAPVSSQKKIKYVDKETGQAPDNKNNFLKREIEQGQRKYSKKQASEVGNQLGNFRNKPFMEKQINNEYMLNQNKKSEPVKLRQLKSAPKKSWINKKNSNPSTKEEEDDEVMEKQDKNFKNKQNEIDTQSKGSKKKYVQKKKRQKSQEEELFSYYDRRQYKMKNNY